jgi:hemoglobin
LLAPIFNEVAGVDWPSHLATLYAFWESMLLGTGTYQGAPFPKHSILPVEKAHFDRWLELFLATADENFSGPKAEEAKGRALSIADTFARRMGLLPNQTVLLRP